MGKVICRLFCGDLCSRHKAALDHLLDQFLDGIPVMGIDGSKLDVHLVELGALFNSENLAVDVTALHAKDVKLEPEPHIEVGLGLCKGGGKHATGAQVQDAPLVGIRAHDFAFQDLKLKRNVDFHAQASPGLPLGNFKVIRFSDGQNVVQGCGFAPALDGDGEGVFYFYKVPSL
jgi:hypothetical protein